METTYKKYTRFLILLLAIISIPVFAQSQTSVRVGKISPGQLDAAAFTLTSDGFVRIHGKGATFGQWEESMAFYGWIINSNTRKVVWHLKNNPEFEDGKGLFNFNSKIELKAGDYEVYYAGSVTNYIQITGWNDFWDNIFGKMKYKSRYRNELYMNIEGPSNIFKRSSPTKLVDSKVKDAIVSIIRVGNYEEYEKSFSLTKDSRIRIYVVGEGRKGSYYDFAWIYDEDHHERFWTMSSKNSSYAGGGKKNVMVDQELILPAGNYSVHYSSDDSHSYDEWNVLPPNDPQFWGITIWPVDKSDLSFIKPLSEKDRNNPIVEMIKVYDNAFLAQGFTLEKDMDIRIFCMGEGSGGDLADYGWIVDADTRSTVWKMNKRHTEPAGGSDKNRLFDGTINLQKGNYIAYYLTDDSHSFQEWNATRPIESERWGITIWARNKADRDYVKLFDEKEYKNNNILAQIVNVRDNRNERRKFTLSSASKVRIISIGEGDSGEMFDYGWIENERGKTIWEMTYRKTEHAGGARKNRKFNDTIYLEKGTYYLHYKSDDSHSFKDWNSSPPDDPDMYGITIMLKK